MKLKIFITVLFFIIPKLSFAKIDLNSATLEDLMSLDLTYEQSQNLLSHKKQYGNLFSIYELQVVPGFDTNVIKKILPHVWVEEFWPEENIVFGKGKKFVNKVKNWRLLFRYERVLEISKGYRNGNYLGSPDDFLTRINFSSQGYKFSLAYRKKYAEYLYPGHIGGYLLLEKKFIFDKIIFGNYQIGCGQSLVLNSSFPYKLFTNSDLAKCNVKIKQNSSTAKYCFQGVASSIKFSDNFESVFFYSYRFLNSKIENSKAKISYSDHYKTLNDLKNKNTLGEQTLGNILTWNKDNSELGCNLVYTRFDHEIRNKFKNQFQGKENYLGSILGETILFDRLNIFGEFTYLKTFSFVLGSALTFLKKITSSFIIRNLSPRLYNFYGQPFHENAEKNNEFGICNVNFFKIKKFNITMAWDYFHFPKPTQKVRISQRGLERILKIMYQFNKRDFISTQLKTKHKKDAHEKDLNNTMTIQITGQKEVDNFLYISQLICKLDKLKSDYGIGFLETLRYKSRKFNVDIFLGTTFTNSVNIYLREPMLKFCGLKTKMFNTPMLLFGCIVNHKISSGFQIEILYDFSYAYKDMKIGLENNEIVGRVKNFIKVQAIYNF